MQFDNYERQYIADRGLRLDDDGLIVLTKRQAARMTGRSIYRPQVRTMTIPSIHGLCLLFEEKHFRVLEGGVQNDR